MPSPLRLAAALTTFGAAGLVATQLVSAPQLAGDRPGYALAISYGTGLRLEAPSASASPGRPDSLTCRHVLRLAVADIGISCLHPQRTGGGVPVAATAAAGG